MTRLAGWFRTGRKAKTFLSQSSEAAKKQREKIQLCFFAASRPDGFLLAQMARAGWRDAADGYAERAGLDSLFDSSIQPGQRSSLTAYSSLDFDGYICKH